jgi:hypothetical protein
VTPLRGPILALHARHEACRREAEAIDRARDDHQSDAEVSAGLADAAAANRAELDALREALLRQVPNGWSDALILAYHLAAGLTDIPAGDGAALRLASESLFDFMASVVDLDHEPLGERFQSATVRALRRRHLRAGRVDPEDMAGIGGE